MVNRRRFLQSIVAATAGSSPSVGSGSGSAASVALRPDPQQIIDLPEGFTYRVLSRAGDRMVDGFRVPGAHDGMAAFPGDDGREILVRNHEMNPGWLEGSPFGSRYAELDEELRARLYDRGENRTLGPGANHDDDVQPRHWRDRTPVPEPRRDRDQLCRGRDAVGQLAEL